MRKRNKRFKSSKWDSIHLLRSLLTPPPKENKERKKLASWVRLRTCSGPGALSWSGCTACQISSTETVDWCYLDKRKCHRQPQRGQRQQIQLFHHSFSCIKKRNNNSGPIGLECPVKNWLKSEFTLFFKLICFHSMFSPRPGHLSLYILCQTFVQNLIWLPCCYRSTMAY